MNAIIYAGGLGESIKMLNAYNYSGTASEGRDDEDVDGPVNGREAVAAGNESSSEKDEVDDDMNELQ